MAQPNRRKWHKSRSQANSQNDLSHVLQMLALDRRLVEFSMRLYKVPQRERSAIRGQNRRLHNAVRERLLGAAGT